MKSIRIPSKDGIHNIYVAIWEPEQQVKAIVQISHGMQEYVERYDEFAQYLNKKGILVIGNDHLGHGNTANTSEELGYFSDKHMSANVVCDLHRVTLYAKKKYPKVPYFLLGHSMGSFMARRYLMTFGNEIDGALIVGTGNQPAYMLTVGKLSSAAIKSVFGSKHRSKFMETASFGAYNKKIESPKFKDDWVTKREEIVLKRQDDKFCNYLFTMNGYDTLFETLTYIQKKSNIDKIPKTLPIYMLAGDEDPVGNYGKGVKKVYDDMVMSGIVDIQLKMYSGMRHEILNEDDRESVYEDIIKWINNHM